MKDNLIVRPCAEEIRADFGLGEDALSGRGITLRDNKRDDEAVATEQAQIVNRLFAFWGVGVVLAWGRGLPDD